MRLCYKILTVFVILFVFCISHVYAIDMFLNSSSNNDDDSQIAEDEESVAYDATLYSSDSFDYDDLETSNEDDDNDLTYLSEEKEIAASESSLESSNPVVTTIGAQTNQALSLSDIINIILIAVCVVLILLSIAILIRCK